MIYIQVVRTMFLDKSMIFFFSVAYIIGDIKGHNFSYYEI